MSVASPSPAGPLRRGLLGRLAGGSPAEGARRTLWTGAALAALLVLLALLAPWLAPHDPARPWDAAAARHLPPGSARLALELADGRTLVATAVRPGDEAGERAWDYERLGAWQRIAASEVSSVRAVAFPLGTDRYGRDLASRLLWGARVSLRIAALSVSLALLLGLLVGAAAGLGPRWLDGVLSRLVDGALAFSRLFLVLAFAALAGSGEAMVIAALAATGWMEVARLLRAELRGLAGSDVALAARATGVPPWRTFWRHLLPLALAPLLATTSLRLADALLAEAALSWLGFGVQAPAASWGSLLADAQASLPDAWWLVAFPGLAVALAVLAAALVGEGLQASAAIPSDARGRET